MRVSWPPAATIDPGPPGRPVTPGNPRGWDVSTVARSRIVGAGPAAWAAAWLAGALASVLLGCAVAAAAVAAEVGGPQVGGVERVTTACVRHDHVGARRGGVREAERLVDRAAAEPAHQEVRGEDQGAHGAVGVAVVSATRHDITTGAGAGATRVARAPVPLPVAVRPSALDTVVSLTVKAPGCCEHARGQAD